MSPAQELSVTVLEDGRLARLFIPAQCDRACLTPSLISALAAQARVRVTPQVQAAIAAACEEFARQPSDLSADIAREIPPVHGAAGDWTWHPDFDPAAAHHAVPAAGSSVDYHVSHVKTVPADAHVATFSQPTDGVDGMTLTGKPIRAVRGGPAPLRIGKGLELGPQGRVRALHSGVLQISGGVVSVVPVLRLPGCVDFSTGNVDFQGDVVVADAVRDGFKIHATGSVTIYGDVEGAEIACAGNLTCPHGIASFRRARISVGGDTDIGFARNVSAILRGDLCFRAELEHCDTTVGGRCSGESGRVIGGILVLSGPASIGTLGSPDWTPTLVCVGELPFIAMDLRRLSAEDARLQRAIAAIDDESRFLALGGCTKGAGARERLTELHYQRGELQKESASLALQIAALRDAEAASRGSELVVERIAHPKVRVQHGPHAFELTRDLRGPIRFSVDERGIIRVRISSQQPRPLSEFAQRVNPTLLEDHQHDSARRAA